MPAVQAKPAATTLTASIDPAVLSNAEFLIYLAGYKAAIADTLPRLEAAEEFSNESADAALDLADRLQRLQSRTHIWETS